MEFMFNRATNFNGNISLWDVSEVTTMVQMFYFASAFNGDISQWDVSAVNSMNSMFRGATAFNGDISLWDVSEVTTMGSMFSSASAFNGDISQWNVSKVTNMEAMFASASAFNGDIRGWDVYEVANMAQMFNGASAFNGDISQWNVSKVTTMGSMFSYATTFNQPLNSWNVSAVTTMDSMFEGATTFGQNLHTWAVTATTVVTDMFKETRMGTGGSISPKSDTPYRSYFNQPPPCFDKKTMILCPNGYKCISELKFGDEVVTYKHGNKKICRIGTRTQVFNHTNDENLCMYRMKKDDTMHDDLMVTGRHAILLDDWSSHIHQEGKLKVPKTMIDDKKPLISSLCNKFEREIEVKQYTVYHIALEGNQNRYGVYANGVLMESWDKRQTSM
jgi:surface protein